MGVNGCNIAFQSIKKNISSRGKIKLFVKKEKHEGLKRVKIEGLFENNFTHTHREQRAESKKGVFQ